MAIVNLEKHILISEQVHGKRFLHQLFYFLYEKPAFLLYSV